MHSAKERFDRKIFGCLAVGLEDKEISDDSWEDGMEDQAIYLIYKWRYKMAGGDGTGPSGRGPMTGKGMGYCVGYASPGYGRGMGRGAGLGYRGGGGYGRGFGFGAGRGGRGPERFSLMRPRPMTLQEERDYLRSEEQFLNEGLRDIKSRLSKLESEKQD